MLRLKTAIGHCSATSAANAHAFCFRTISNRRLESFRTVAAWLVAPFFRRHSGIPNGCVGGRSSISIPQSGVCWDVLGEMTLTPSNCPASVAILIRTGTKYEHVIFSIDLSCAVRVGDAPAGAAFVRATESRAVPAAGSCIISARRSASAVRCAGAGSGARGRGSARADCGGRHDSTTSRRRPIAEIDDGGAARIVALVDVPVGGYSGQGCDDWPRIRLAGDVDDL